MASSSRGGRDRRARRGWRKRRAERLRSLRVESLEVRTMFAVMPAVTVGGAGLSGDAADDSLYLRAGGGNLLEYSIDGSLYSTDFGGGAVVALSGPVSVVVDLGGGVNRLAVDASLVTALTAGGGQLLYQGSGQDALAGPALASVWTVTATNAGTVGDRITFTGVRDLLGAAGNVDTFVFAANAGVTGLVDGGVGGFDSLEFQGLYTTAVLTAVNASSGSVAYDGLAVQYTGLEPISIAAVNVVVTGSPLADAIVVQPSGPGMLEVSSPATMETVTFPVPTGSLTVDAAAGNDTVTLLGTIAMPGANLTVKAETILAGVGTTIDTTLLSGTDGDVDFTAAAAATLPSTGGATTLIDVAGATIRAGDLTMTAQSTVTGTATQGPKLGGGQISNAAATGGASVLVSGATVIVTSGHATLAAVSALSVTATTTSTAGGSDAIDAAVALAQAASAATASVAGSSSLTVAGNLSIAATNTVAVTLLADGTAGGGTAAGAAVARAAVTGTTTATIGGTATVQAAGVTVAASVATDVAATSKATAKGASGNDAATTGALASSGAATADGSITLVAALAVTDLTIDNRASIGPGSTVTATSGAVRVEATADTSASATADGSTTALPSGTGVAVGINLGSLGNRATVAGTVTGTGVEVLASQPASSGNEFKAVSTSGASDATKVGVAGSFALNSVSDTTQALLEPSAVVDGLGGAVRLQAEQTSQTTTKADAKVSGSPSLAGVGASVAITKETNPVEAAIQNGAQVVGGSDLVIDAKGAHTVATEGRGGASGGTGVAASVALNFLESRTTGRIGTGGTIVVPGSVAVTADSSGAVTAKADGTASGTTAAIGASIAITVATEKAEATTLRSLTAGGPVSIVATTGSDLGTEAKASTKGAASSTKKADDQAGDQLAVGGAAAGPSASTSDGKVGVAAAIGLAVITSQAEAGIPSGVTVTSGGLVKVETSSETDSAVTADGTASSGASGSVGVAVAINKATVLNRATVAGTVTGTGVEVLASQPASSGNEFKAVSTSGASDATKVGVAGSFALNSVSDTTQALLQPSAVVDPGPAGDITIRAARSQTDLAHAKAAVKLVIDTPPTDSTARVDSLEIGAAPLGDAPTTSGPTVGTKQTVGVGASVALSLGRTSITQAEARDGSTILGGRDLTLAADSSRTVTTTAEAGVEGGVAISPVVAIALIDHDTIARLGTASGGPLALTGSARIEAIHESTTKTTADATAAGGSVAVGAAVAVTVADDDTQATIARSIWAAGDVTAAAGRGRVSAVTEAKASAKGASSGGRKADQEAHAQVNNNPNTTGQVLPSASSQAAGASSTATAKSGQGSGGVGIAAAVAVHRSTTSTTATVGVGVQISASGSVAVSSVDDTDVTAKATGTSLMSSAAANIGAAVAISTPTVINEATVAAGGQITATGITIEAVNAAGAVDEYVVWGLAATKGKDEFGLAASVAINAPTLTTRAATGAGTTLWAQKGITIQAANALGLQAVAAAGGMTTGVGVGAALAFNNVQSTTEAFLGEGAAADAVQGLSVSAGTTVVPLTVSIPKIGGGPKVTAVALSGSISQGQAGIGGSVVVENLTIATRAFLAQGTVVNALTPPGPNQSVSVTATDSVSLSSGAGGLAGSTGAVGIGIGVDVAVVNKDTRAFIAPLAKVRAGGDVAVVATSAGDVSLIAASVGVALGGVAVGGTVAVGTLNEAPNAGTRAFIDGAAGTGATVIAGGNVLVSASEVAAAGKPAATDVVVIAGSLAFGSEGGVGGGVALLIDSGTVQARIGQNGTVQANGNAGVTTTATRRANRKTFAVGGAGAGSASVAGASARTIVSGAVDARIESGTAVTAAGPVAVAAAETASIQSLAGGVAGAGGLGFGAAVARNDVSGGVSAEIVGATVNSLLDRVDVAASSTSEVVSSAVGGVGAGTFSAGGSLATNNLSNTIRGRISGGAGVTAARAVAVGASNTPVLRVQAGVLAGAGGAAVGAAIVTNNIHGLTAASIEGSTVTSTAEGVQVVATWTPVIWSLAVGGFGAGSFAAGGSVATNFIPADVDARVSGNAGVSAAGKIVVSAAATPTIDALAGSVAGAGGAAVGAAVATNDISSFVTATASGSSTTLTAGAQGIDVRASLGGSIKALAVGGVGAGGLAVAGSVATNIMTAFVDARVIGGATLTAVGTITVAATLAPANCATHIEALAGGVAGAGGAAIGAAVATNSLFNTVQARVEGSTVDSSSGTVAITATGASGIKALSVGGAGAGGFALGGSVSTNSIGDIFNAHVSLDAVVSATGRILIAADNRPSVTALAGGFSGAGAVAIAAAVATNDLAGTVTGYVDDASVTSRSGAIAVEASSRAAIKALAVGGDGAGAFAAGGSVPTNIVRDVVNARVVNDANLYALDTIDVRATDVPSLNALAGNVSGAGAVAIAAAVATNDSATTTIAFIEKSSVYAQGYRPGGMLGNVGVSATSTPTVDTMALGGAGAAFFAAGGSVAIMKLANVVDAHVGTAANVRAGGTIGLSAVSTTSVDLDAGAIGGAIAFAGAGVATATVTNRTEAYVNGAAVLTAPSLVQIFASGVFSSFTVDAFIGGGGIVALEAARAEITSGSQTRAFVSGGAAVRRAAAVSVTATSVSPLEADGYGATVGLASVGRAVARAKENGLTTAFVDGGARIGDPADSTRSVGSLTLAADTTATLRSKAWAVTAGIGTAGFNEATASVLPTVRATISGNETKVYVTETATITAGAEGTAASNVFSLSVGGLAGGQSTTNATENPTVEASVGSGAVVEAGVDVVAGARHNVAGGSGARAEADAPVIAVAGLGGARPVAVASPMIDAFVAPNGIVRAARNLSVSAVSTSAAVADARAVFGGGLGKGSSMPEATASGTIRARVDGTAFVDGNVAVTTSATNTASTTGNATAVGLLAGVGVAAASTVSPTILATIGDGTSPAAVTAGGGIDVSVASIGDADATGRGVVGSLVGMGTTKAATTLTPNVAALVGQSSTVTSTLGGITLAARHNRSSGGAATGHGARSTATAAGGGIVTVDRCLATAVNAPVVQALGSTGATIVAKGNLTLRALADSTATSSADGTAGGVVVDAGARSSATANGTTRAEASNVAALRAGGDLTVFASGTHAATSSASVRSGGFVNHPGTSADAMAMPWILAAISAGQPVVVGGSADIKGVVQGDVTVDAQGAGGGAVQIGTTRASGVWQPVVEARVGSGTVVTAGVDISIQALNNCDDKGVPQPGRRVKADAGAMGGGVVSVDGASVDTKVNSTVTARVGASANLTAGRDLVVLSRSRNNLEATADGRSIGLVSKGSVIATGLMLSTTQARTDDASSWAPTRLAATRVINVGAYSDNAGDVSVTGGAGGLVGSGIGRSTLHLQSPLTLARLGTYTITPCQRPYCDAILNVTAQNVVNLRADSYRTVTGGVVHNRSDATAMVTGGQTLAEIATGCDIRMRQVNVLADDAWMTVFAEAIAVVPFNLGGTNTANSQADLTSHAKVTIFSGAKICGTQQVSLVAQTQVARTYSHAKTDTTGVTGNLISNAGSVKNVSQTVVTQSGAQIRTGSLIVAANQPALDPAGYVKWPETRAATVVQWVISGFTTVCTWVANVACLWGLLCDPVQVCNQVANWVQQVLGADVTTSMPGSQTITPTVQNNATITITPASCCCEQTLSRPRLVVDAAGRIMELEGLTARDGDRSLVVGDTVSSDTIVVEPFANDFAGRIEIMAFGGSIEGFSEIDVDATTDISISNASAKNLAIQGLATFNTKSPPTITYVATSGQANWKYALKPARETSVVVTSTSPTGGDVILVGDLINPRGVITIHTAGGSIRAEQPGGEIIAQGVDLVAEQGAIGGAGAPLNLVFPINELPPVGIIRASGKDGVSLTVQTPTGVEDPITFVLANVSSAGGDVNVTVLDATRQPQACGCEDDGHDAGQGQGESHDPVPASSTVTIRDITAGGTVRVTAGSSTKVPTEIIVEGGVTAAREVILSATGSMTQTWSGAGQDGTWSNPQNWQGGVIPQAGARLLFPGATGSASFNDLPAGMTFASITVQPGGPQLKGHAVSVAAREGAGLWLAGTGTFALPLVLTQPTRIDVSAGAPVFGAGIDTAGHTLTIETRGHTAATLAAAITGAGRLVVIGDVTLAGVASHQGGTLIASGTLQVGAGGVDGSLAGDVVSYGTLAFNRSDDVTFGGIISGPGRVTNLGTGTPLLTGANTYSGGTWIDGGLAAGSEAALGTGPVTMTAGGLLTVGAAGAKPVNLAIASLSGEAGSRVRLQGGSLTTGGDGRSTEFAGVIEGTGDVVKVGGGDLRLSGMSTFTGGTVVAEGSLSVDVVADGDATRGSNIGNPTRPVVLGGPKTEGTLVYGGESARFAGGLQVGPAGGRLLVRPCGHTLFIGGGVSHASQKPRLTVGGEGNVTIMGAVDLGAGTLVKVDEGRLTLEGPGTIGATVVDAGSLVAAPGSLGAGIVSVAPGATLTASDLGGLQGAGTVDLAGRPLVIDGTSDVRFSGSLVDSVGGSTIVKRGGGTMILDGDNSGYQGSIVVEQGTLRVNAVGGITAGAIAGRAGAAIVFDVGTAQVSLARLDLAPDALLDVGRGSVRIASGITEAELVARLADGRGAGGWTGARGITSSSAAAGVAAGENLTVGWIGNPDGSFVVGLTGPGDTNLDGLVDILDVAALLTADLFDSLTPGTWSTGDFNYDGIVDILDLVEFLNGGLFDAGMVVPAVAAAAGLPGDTDAAAGPAPQDLAFAAFAPEPSAASPRKKAFAAR